MNILDKIAAHKQEEVQMKKELLPIEALRTLPLFNHSCISLSQNLRGKSAGIITEFKRKSPSKPNLNLKADPEEIALGYQKAGAAGISVLTDEEFFGGSNEDLILVRQQVQIPILRKDFIIDEYQILEAKAIGADVILLIAAILSPKEIKTFSKFAKSLGLEVLLEVHNEEELQSCITEEIDLIGVNNRNLKTFEVDINISKQLSPLIPDEFVKISESGISDIATVKELNSYGFQGFLMGENFMKTADPGLCAETFIKTLEL